MASEKKPDRRTLYTGKAIQAAFLRVKRAKKYNAITVTDICREAGALFYFQINGCFAVSKRYSNSGAEEWGPVQNVTDQFIKGGISSIPCGPN